MLRSGPVVSVGCVEFRLTGDEIWIRGLYAAGVFYSTGSGKVFVGYDCVGMYESGCRHSLSGPRVCVRTQTGGRRA